MLVMREPFFPAKRVSLEQWEPYLRRHAPARPKAGASSAPARTVAYLSALNACFGTAAVIPIFSQNVSPTPTYRPRGCGLEIRYEEYSVDFTNYKVVGS